MQKIQKNKGSILIWSFFLSIIIIITFLNLSSKVNKNLKNNLQFNNSIKLNYEIKEILKNLDFSSKILSNNDNIIFDSNNNYTWSLNNNQVEIIQLSQINTFNLKIINWWPIYFKTPINDWVISTNDTITNIPIWNIYIKNLWWYTKYNINSTNSFTTQTKKYKITKTIWNKEVILTSWEIKNF